MADVVRRWTGREARALREAKRMTVREFAAHLGVSERTVSKWEAGAGDIEPRPEMQAALDTALEKAGDDVTARFLQSLGDGSGPSTVTPGAFVVQSQKFIPVFIGVEAARQLAGRRTFGPRLDSALGCRAQPLKRPDGRATLYVFACGVAVVHLRQRCDLAFIADLAAWRCATAATDRKWVADELAALLPDHEVGRPESMVWLSCLEQSMWSDLELETALRLMCLPAVLVDRDDPAGPRPVGNVVEQWQLASGFEHPDIVSFGVRGVSIGYVCWSGRSYFPLAPRRALTTDDVVAAELQVQMLLCYTRHLQTELENDSFNVPDVYGWRFLRSIHSRLTTPRAGESIQHRLMRDALLKATGLPDRLRHAQELLHGQSS